jgi:hypothetical protein
VLSGLPLASPRVWNEPSADRAMKRWVRLRRGSAGSVNEMIMPGRRLRAEVGTVMMTSPGLTTGAIEPDMITSARNPATWASSYQTVAQQNSASTKTAPARVRSRIISCSGLAS